MIKKPTSTDLKIYEHMQSGEPVNAVTALNKFRTTSLRDVAYRLRKAGYNIISEVIHYKNDQGKHKCYTNYFVEKGEAA